MELQNIEVTNAREHNLKGINVSIPKNKITVITGPSGSGKSSLAFSTIYAEAQRKYIESMSSQSKYFMKQFSRPDVESITGLSPAISVEQKSSSINPRSTVGTLTEIYDYLRLLFSKIATQYCPETGEEIKSYSPISVAAELLKLDDSTKIHILAPIEFKNSEELEHIISGFSTRGFSRIRLNNKISLIEEVNNYDDINSCEIIIDRIIIKKNIKSRLIGSIEEAYKQGNEKIEVLIGDSNKTIFFSRKNISRKTKKVFPNLSPQFFSFNSPAGACTTCNGLGEIESFDISKMIFDDSLSISSGGIEVITSENDITYKLISNISSIEKINISKPIKSLEKEVIDFIFFGNNKKYKFEIELNETKIQYDDYFKGITGMLENKFNNTKSKKLISELRKYMSIQLCRVCNGTRLNEYANNARIGNYTIHDVASKTIDQINDYFSELSLSKDDFEISKRILSEIKSRVSFIKNIGINYLTLARKANTLSGGELQRIKLATHLGSTLSGIIYVLDEPSIGLHQKDNDKLLTAIKKLNKLGNTIVMVEHDEDTIKAADYVIDIGPGAGVSGGEIIFAGYTHEFKNFSSQTSSYIYGNKKISIPSIRRSYDQKIFLTDINENNIKGESVSIPLNNLVCITGVSGSGKSTLLHKVLSPAIKKSLNKKFKSIYEKTNYRSITGINSIKSIIELDQSAIGKSPKSNPATYIGLYDSIRDLFTKVNESQVRGYTASRFSFNIKGGRCDECEGYGTKKVEMHFLPDVHIICKECNGSKFNDETLSILYKGINIAEVLNLTVKEAKSFFKNHSKISRYLTNLSELGLDYIKLGQPANTLSGGESQRIKLAKELSKQTRGHCLYILDEPTTGLHFQDIELLLSSLHKLVNKDNSVLVIEHNLEVIKNADYIIDLGPEGGAGGGKVIGEGSPEDLINNFPNSYTAKYLGQKLCKNAEQ